MSKASEVELSPSESLLRALDINFRITRYLIENIPSEAWSAEPAGGKGRTIAAITAHTHNVRRMWLKVASGKPVPDEVDRHTLTPRSALAALDASASAVHEMVAESLASGKRIKNFKPDTTAFAGYIIAHDAHHRGQIAMLARQGGFALPKQVDFGMWEWGIR